MPDSMDFHIKLGPVHSQLIKNLMKQTGMSRTELVKWGIYRLAMDEKIIPSEENIAREGKHQS